MKKIVLTMGISMLAVLGLFAQKKPSLLKNIKFLAK
jgi:hypothetical protein